MNTEIHDETKRLRFPSSITSEDELTRMQENDSFDNLIKGAGDEASWFESVSTSPYNSIEEARNFYKKSQYERELGKELEGFEKKRSLLTLEIVDGLPDGFINLPPGQMIASLASLVMTKIPKYNLDADAIKYVVRGGIENPLPRINKFIEDEEEASRKPQK